MSSRDLQNAAQRMTLNIPGQRTCDENFLLSMNAITRGMAHSSGAEKHEVTCLHCALSLDYLFCNFRIKVMR